LLDLEIFGQECFEPKQLSNAKIGGCLHNDGTLTHLGRKTRSKPTKLAQTPTLKAGVTTHPGGVWGVGGWNMSFQFSWADFQGGTVQILHQKTVGALEHEF
jgi:hypothetical protein